MADKKKKEREKEGHDVWFPLKHDQRYGVENKANIRQ